MGTATASPEATAIEALETLVSRFEITDMDVPGGSARIRLEVTDDRGRDAIIEGGRVHLAPPSGEPDARLTASTAAWAAIADDVAGGMRAFRRGQLKVRDDLHLGIGFLAATTGSTDAGRLRFGRAVTPNHDIAWCAAGEGPPLVCLHGLGGTKSSFMPTMAGVAPEGFRVIAIDLPGFGDSDKPHSAPYDAPWFAGVVVEALDALGIERASFAGNSMGGRIALELGIAHQDRTDKLVLLAPALAWLKERRWKWILQAPLPRLGYIQPTPRRLVEPVVRKLVPGGDRGWTAAGIDEFLRAYLTPAGRFAFYECLRNIYLDEPYGEQGLWTRIKKLGPEALFVWGREDALVPISFMRHVERALPRSTHLELDCGHVPQVERPEATNAAIVELLRRG